MTVHEHRATVTAVAGAVGSTTLTIPGGLCRQVLIRSTTSLATIFRADLTDANGTVRKNYAYHEGELNDINPALPMAGVYTINITNASANDTFSILVGIQE